MRQTRVCDERMKYLISGAPEGCGVYLLRDKSGRILYIGKSISIRKRLVDHFNAARCGVEKEELILGHTRSVEFIVTENELEALILENNLIKLKRPRYNIIMRDDKNYPYLRIDPREEFARVTVVRGPADDGALYFGPYIPARAMRRTLHYTGAAFPLRKCAVAEIKKRQRPCINHGIGRCLAPCLGLVTKEEYGEVVKELVMFLRGRRKHLVARLEKRMMEASRATRFEEAARLRDRLREMRLFFEKQSVYGQSLRSADIIGLAAGRTGWAVYVMFVRHGSLVGGQTSFLHTGYQTCENDVLEEFIERFYSSREDIPAELVLPVSPAAGPLLERFLSSRRGRRARISVPVKGRRLELLLMARKNALNYWNRKKTRWPPPEAELWAASGIRLSGGAPERIEAYDASSIQGNEAVVGMVLWENGAFRREGYRRYRIKSTRGPDDYSMIAEAIRRRYRRIGTGEFPSPDVVLIDGGVGHVTIARRELDHGGFGEVPVIGISKGTGRGRVDHLHLQDGSSPCVAAESPLMRFLGSLRDEVHRFAINYHRQRRGKSMRMSALDNIRGLGPRRKTILVKYFGDLRAVAAAGLEDIEAVPGIPADVAAAVYRSFHPSTPTRQP